ncbi:MAG: gliding motility-associated C-terminal domain-containing protein [Saprospirales bacterium]|nr:gliding motility-associated C-terminal domain-containing protein [Saprospirales bacterium]
MPGAASHRPGAQCFAPNGFNQVFRPAIQYPNTITSFRMQIFDRYGQQVFESADWSEG